MDENSSYGNYTIPTFLNSTAKIVAITAILYYLIAKLSLFIFVTEINILPFFPAIGFAIAAVLLWGRKVIFGVMIGCLLFSISLYKSEFQNAITFEEFIKPLSLCIIRPIIAGLNVFLVSYLSQWWCKKKYPFDSEKNVLYFAFASLLGTFVSVSIGFMPLVMTSYFSMDDCFLIWSNMLRGNALGIVIFTPFVLSWFNGMKEFTAWLAVKKMEVFFLIIITLSLSLYIFESHANNESILFFLLIWAACRFEMKIITLVVLIITIIAIYCTGHHMGGFVFSGWNKDFLMLQLFLFVNMISVLFLKAILKEKENEESKLKISEQDLSLEKNILKATIESPKGISISSLDMNLNYLSFNSAHERYMKNENDAEIKIGDNHLEFIKDITRKEEINSIFQSVLRGNIFSVEAKDAEGAYWNITKSPIKNWKNEIIGVTTIVSDITELKLKEIQLGKNNIELNERLKELDCLYTISETFRSKKLTKAQKLQACVDIIPKGMKFPEISNCRIQFKGEEFFSANYHGSEGFFNKSITINGEDIGSIEVGYFDAERELKENLFTNEEVKLFEALTNIISKAIETKIAEENLKISEEKFRSIYENSLDIYFKKDLEGTILEIGPSVDKHLNQKRESMIGKNIRDYYYDIADTDRFYEFILKEKQIIDYQEKFVSAAGAPVYLSVNAKLINDANGQPMYVEGTRRNISERILNEKHLLEATEKIKESEEKYRSIFENMQDIYYMHTLDGKLLDISPSVEKNLKYKREEMIGRDTTDFFYDLSIQKELRERIIIDGFITDEIIQYVTATGEPVYFSVNCRVIYDQNGQKKHVEGSLRNIDERINDQKQLVLATDKIKESEEKYRSIFENTQDVYYMHNFDGRIFEVSPSVEKNFKYTREEMIGLYTGDLYYDPTKQNELREKITRDGIISDEHVQFVTATGEPVYFSVNCKIIFDSDGSPSHVEGSMRNINERISNQQKLIEASEKIKESEERFRSIYENMHDVYFKQELDGTLIDISPSAEKNFPTKRENLIGLNSKSFYTNPARFDELTAKALKDGYVNDQEVQFLTATGEVMYFSVSAKLINDEKDNRTLVEGTMRNINERINNQKQLLEASEKIKESEEKFRSIYENMEDVYFLHEVDGTVIDISPSAEKVFQIKKEEFIGTKAQIFHVSPARHEELQEKLQKYGSIHDEEVEFLTANGETIYFSASAKLINHHSDNRTLVEGTMRNINERISSQKLLLEASEKIKVSEEKFRSIFENMEDVYYLHNIDGTLLNTSPSAEKYFNIKREDLIGDKVQKLFTNPLRYDELTEITLREGFINDKEVEFVSPSGETMYFSVNSKLINDSNGVPILAEGTMRNISERINNQKQLLDATEKIKKSEEEFRAIFESFEDLYFRVSMDGTIQNVSPSIEKILKFKRDEIINTNTSDLYLYPEDRIKVLDVISENGQINDFETVFKDKNKNPVHLSVSSHMVYDFEGNPICIEGSMRDISERKKNEQEIEKANQAIKESEQKYRTIFESVRDVFFRASAIDHTILDISPSCAYFNVLPEDVIGKQIEGFYLNPEERQDVLKVLRQNGEIKNYDAVFSINSKTYNVSINSKVVFDQDNNPEFVIGSFRDVTARIQAEENLKISEAKFRSIYENFEDVYFKTELDGTIIDLSPSFERNFKMPLSESIGKSTLDFYYHEEDRHRAIDLLSRNENLNDFDAQFLDGEGNILFFSINARLIRDTYGNAVYFEGTMRNVNERSLMQEEMLAKNRTLEFQNTELEQFAYIASHDLQEPLITVIHCIELLQEGLYENLDDEKKQYLGFINSSTSRMQQLVKGLLDYSRIGKGRKNNQIDCNEIVANVLADMDVSLKESNAIIECENLPIIQGYSTEIRQLFQNIISNANKYQKKDQQPKIKIAAVKEEYNWVFSIEDNGIGIKEEDMEKVFEIFKRLHNRNDYQGTGIGLSHCKKIVEHHKGKIWVESKYNEGSTFKWTFPIEQN